MGDDRDSSPPAPEGRAPWERPISRISHEPRSPSSAPVPPASSTPASSPPASSPPASRRKVPEPTAKSADSETPSGKFNRLGKRSSRKSDSVSVADLVDKMADDDPLAETPSVRAWPSRPEVDDPTEKIDPITDSTPSPVSPPPVVALPEAVGSPADDRPVLTRLAMSKVRRQKRLRNIGRGFVSLVAVLALALTGMVWGYLRSTDKGFAQVAALDLDSTDVVDAAGQYGDETYLIVGTDTRTGASGQVGAGTVADAEGARSDTVMLVNIPADRSRVVAVSFPRDLDVVRPECEGFDNSTNTYTGEMYPSADGDKLNATYALGGPKCLVKTIQKISGLKISHFVGMDFAGFESMVDEVGGVEVCTPQPLVDYELGTVLETAGEQRIDGRTALNYVRARNVESEGNGDYGRIKRQQRFLSSLLRSALSNKVLLDPGKLNGFVNAFTSDTFVENVKTKDLVTLGRSLQNVDAGAVTFLTIPTSGTNDWGNEIPIDDAIAVIFSAIINDEPLPGEERRDPPPSAEPSIQPTAPLLAVDPTTVSIQVSNASEMVGMAATASSELSTYGFQILDVGNFVGTAKQTVVRFSEGQESEAATVASAIPGAVIEQAQGLDSIVEVVLGSDYPGYSTAPTAFGEPIEATRVQGSTEGAPLPEDLSFTNAADDTCA
ncbi:MULTISPECIES: LCP family protein [unclassified Rhodococcus (in: high G+C Gram-positive bacteria)]|uniref:LCP family protein n=1 Tax=unclassified Rhodococcus (in: high G+C Gram-positive bacteria) TaxID=192944 RepID=UPI003397FBD4